MRTTVVKASNPHTTSIKSAVVNTEYNAETLQDKFLTKETQKERHETTKVKQKTIKAIENTVPLDEIGTVEATTIVTREEAFAADPVVEDEKGIKQWYKPNGDITTADGKTQRGVTTLNLDSSLNEFLGIIGVLNDPTKGVFLFGREMKDGTKFYLVAR